MRRALWLAGYDHEPVEGVDQSCNCSSENKANPQFVTGHLAKFGIHPGPFQ